MTDYLVRKGGIGLISFPVPHMLPNVQRWGFKRNAMDAISAELYDVMDVLCKEYPSNSMLYLNRASLLIAGGRFLDAYAAMLRVVHNSNSIGVNVYARLKISLVVSKMGDPECVEDTVKETLAFVQSNPDSLLRWMTWFMLELDGGRWSQQMLLRCAAVTLGVRSRDGSWESGSTLVELILSSMALACSANADDVELGACLGEMAHRWVCRHTPSQSEVKARCALQVAKCYVVSATLREHGPARDRAWSKARAWTFTSSGMHVPLELVNWVTSSIDVTQGGNPVPIGDYTYRTDVVRMLGEIPMML